MYFHTSHPSLCLCLPHPHTLAHTVVLFSYLKTSVCCCCCSITKSCPTRQAPLSMGFSRQEHWSGLPFPSPGDLTNPGIEPTSPALAGEFFTTEPPGKAPEFCVTSQMSPMSPGWFNSRSHMIHTYRGYSCIVSHLLTSYINFPSFMRKPGKLFSPSLTHLTPHFLQAFAQMSPSQWDPP